MTVIQYISENKQIKRSLQYSLFQKDIFNLKIPNYLQSNILYQDIIKNSSNIFNLFQNLKETLQKLELNLSHQNNSHHSNKGGEYVTILTKEINKIQIQIEELERNQRYLTRKMELLLTIFETTEKELNLIELFEFLNELTLECEIYSYFK